MLSEKLVREIAHLSRIHLNDNEVKRLTKELEGILHYVEKLQKLSVDKTAPTSHVLPLKNVFREDAVKPSLPQSEAIKIAVSKHRGSFKVPQVIE